VVVCELDDNIERQDVIDRATIACGVFSIVQGCFCPSHDHKFAEQRYVSVQALEECNAKVFGTNRLHFQIVYKLNSIAPSLCAPWLSF